MLTTASWLVARRSTAGPNVRMLLGISCLCSVLIMVLTGFAAPLMWAVGASADDAAVLGTLLDQFTFWTNFRIGFADLSFLAVVLALADLAFGRRA